MDSHQSGSQKVIQTTARPSAQGKALQKGEVAASQSFLTMTSDHETDNEFGCRVQRTSGLGRYKKGIRNIIPVRFSHQPKNVLPLETNGFINYITFGWLSTYIWQVFRKGVQSVRHLQISRDESAEVSAQRIERFWKEEIAERGEKNASFGRAIYKSFKTRLLIGAIVSLINAFLSLANPMLVIRYFLEYLTNEDVTIKSGIIYAVLLGLILLLRGVSGSFFWMINFEAAARIKYGSLALLYRKIVHLKALQDKTVGDIVNFISNDGQRIWDGIVMAPFIIGGPMILVMGAVYSVVYLGPWTLVSFVVLIGFYPFAMVLAKKSQNFREQSIKITDKRVGLLNELLTYIKLIKMYAWEISFTNKISDLRSEEKAALEKCVFAHSVSMGSSMMVPIFASCITFIAYVATGNNLTAAEAFTFVSLLNTMQSSMMTIPFAMKALSEMVVTTKRLQEILIMEEISSYPKITNGSSVVEMKNASFSWKTNTGKKEVSNGTHGKVKQRKKKQNSVLEEEETLRDKYTGEGSEQIFVGPTLRNVTFTLQRGQFVGVCGNVGSGKSSLISAILGRMDVSSGTVSVFSHIAYVSQQAWITNDTLRENIVFGYDFEADRYKQVVEACALNVDFATFPAGDATEVGERGTNLSGGQKQRVSLARAAYSKCDLILLDDPLSAVDVRVGHHIYQRCIKEFMKGRSIMLVTHNLQYLKDCDNILVMKDGMIVEQGSHDQLLNAGKEYANLLNIYGSILGQNSKHELEEVENAGGSRSSGPDGNNRDLRVEEPFGSNENLNLVALDVKANNSGIGKLIVEENMDTGALQLPVVHKYILSMGGYPVMLLVFFCFCLPVVGVTTAGWYLSYWLEQGGGNSSIVIGNLSVPNPRVRDHPDLEMYLLIYASFIPILIFSTLLRSFSLMKATLRASSNLHNLGFSRILHCPISFFDATPVGRIVNRFSADLDEIDVRLPMNLEVFLTNTLQVVASLAMIAYVSPWFLLAALPLGILFFFLMIVFHVCIRQLKCLDNITRSPIISHMGSSVQGLTCISAYGKTRQFIKKHCELLNTNSVAVFLFYAASRWLALRLDLVSAGVGFFTALLILLTYDHLNPALAGLALSYSVQMSGLFQFTARLAVETEARFTSVQRILEYCNINVSEASASKTSRDLSKEWPRSGAISFNGVKLRYRSNAPLALNDITFDVKPCEHVGIVGRTGAGKSSLTVALFRLVEMEAGKIFIDDLDITTIALEELRSRLTIIPQDPVLFTGNIRFNLDPFHHYSDADIWQALEKCHIANMVKSLEQQLDTSVMENGDNFSVGERQLLCMARALLRNNRILVLDEATAAIDSETDTLLQQTLKEAFTGCTMLIIAHRLHTVLGCSRILVMEEGKIKEFDSPANLLANTNSMFRAMYEAANSSKHERS